MKYPPGGGGGSHSPFVPWILPTNQLTRYFFQISATCSWLSIMWSTKPLHRNKYWWVGMVAQRFPPYTWKWRLDTITNKPIEYCQNKKLTRKLKRFTVNLEISPRPSFWQMKAKEIYEYFIEDFHHVRDWAQEIHNVTNRANREDLPGKVGAAK